MLVYVVFCCFFFFKQKTAYEMRISDWSSDVCSSDLLTTLGNPDLKPEKSRSWTVGALIEPIPGVSFTADYYNIKKTGAISAPNFAPAIAAYYTGQPIPDGSPVIPDAADPGPPGALPPLAVVQRRSDDRRVGKECGR